MQVLFSRLYWKPGKAGDFLGSSKSLIYVLFFGKVYFSGLRNLRSTWVHGLYVCFHSLQIAPGCSDQPSSSMAISLINSPSTVSSQDFISCRMTSTSEMKVSLRHGLPRRKVLVKVPFFEWTTRS